jgi:hypothetical protein
MRIARNGESGIPQDCILIDQILQWYLLSKLLKAKEVNFFIYRLQKK